MKSMDIKPVGFGVVGLGMGQARAKQIKDESEKGLPVKLVSICDIDTDRGREYSEKYNVPWTTDYKELLSNPEIEVVYVVTETGNHAKIAIDALNAGKHVLSTKPLEASLKAGKTIAETAEKNAVKLAVDFDKRHTSEPTQRIKNAIDQGLLGKILLADVSLKVLRTDEYFKERGGWRGTWALDGGGAMSNQGIHEIDALYWFLGMPDTVEAKIWTQNHAIEAEDLGIAIWNYQDGAVASFKCTTSWIPGGWYFRQEIHGTRGAVVCDSQGNEKWFLDGQWQECPPECKVDLTSATVRFARAIRLGEPMPVDGREGLRSLSILKAMYESAKLEKPVSPIELLKLV
jgi:UDP-N-acetyl-2-amino-2-deoxyglucuronate dehydrogenase